MSSTRDLVDYFPEFSRPLENLLDELPRYLFFTGKGGVGKTSLASATALALSRQGKKVLLISTDPASNLDEVLNTSLHSNPTEIPGETGLYALNINPEAAAKTYREKILGPLRGVLPEKVLASMEEQLSGACTTEIAAFDEFAAFLGDIRGGDFEHLIFDTAPTGHTLRLMALSRAWTSFFNENQGGQSCLGPLAGLEKQREVYAAAVQVLQDPAQTVVVLVTRPLEATLREARRTSEELKQLEIGRQVVILNGWFALANPDDRVAYAWACRQAQAVAEEEAFLRQWPLYLSVLRSRNIIGKETLAQFFFKEESTDDIDFTEDDSDAAEVMEEEGLSPEVFSSLQNWSDLVETLARNPRGVVFTMGKGGVGKTSIAAALALALAERGVDVHLSTTDPAAHLRSTLGKMGGELEISEIDPATETRNYVEAVLAEQGKDLDPSGRALLEEDLRSPCTEEIAVFRAFARAVARGEERLVIMDTAPTGHTLLLLDHSEAYHRELARQSRQTGDSAIRDLLPRLRDPAFTRVILTTIPEATPVHEAMALGEDLQRAGINPFCWVINQSLAGVETFDPMIKARGKNEIRYFGEILEMAQTRPVYLLPWCAEDPVGKQGLRALP